MRASWRARRPVDRRRITAWSSAASCSTPIHADWRSITYARRARPARHPRLSLSQSRRRAGAASSSRRSSGTEFAGAQRPKTVTAGACAVAVQVIVQRDCPGLDASTVRSRALRLRGRRRGGRARATRVAAARDARAEPRATAMTLIVGLPARRLRRPRHWCAVRRLELLRRCDRRIAVPRPNAARPNRGDGVQRLRRAGDFFGRRSVCRRSTDGTRQPAGRATPPAHSTTSRSHFDAQRFMEVGKPGDPTLVTGWLGRHLATVPPMQPTRRFAASASTRPAADARRRPAHAADSRPGQLPAVAANTATRTRASMRSARRIPASREPLAPLALDTQPNDHRPATRASTSAATRRPAARCIPNGRSSACVRPPRLIKADVGVEAIAIDIGGWDTHARQGPTTGRMHNTMQDFAGSARRVLRRRDPAASRMQTT